MKKVVNGKVYNTETAELIGSLSRGGSLDFEYERTGLYKTKKGQFFLAGEGGASSRWSRPAPYEYGQIRGAGVQPLGPEDALEFASKIDVDAELIATYFGDLVTEA